MDLCGDRFEWDRHGSKINANILEYLVKCKRNTNKFYLA